MKSALRANSAGMHLSGLVLYPVKSLRGCVVDSAEVDALGLVGDRRFLIVDEHDRFLTQRTVQRMIPIATALSTDTLTLSAPGAGETSVPRAADARAPLRRVTVWGSEGLLAEDCGDAPAGWLSDVLAVRCRLVRIGRKFLRPVERPGCSRPGDVLHFADGAPFLIASEASLAELNDRLAARDEPPLPMDRFRPNLIVSGCAPYAEDTWPRFRVGGIAFRAAGPCKRCVVTTTDQLTGERTKEPLRLLASYRRHPRDPTEVIFGQNLIHEAKSGTLRVGDAVIVG